jgi:hypothetical protein
LSLAETLRIPRLVTMISQMPDLTPL